MESKDKTKKTEVQEEGVSWSYRPSGGQVSSPAPQDAEVPSKPADVKSHVVEWTASEFVAHEKGFGWYVLLVVIAAAVASGIYFVTRDVFSVAAVLIIMAIFAVAGSRKPRVITYRVDAYGLTVGSRLYPYSDYKAFLMSQEGPFTAIALVPMKRITFPVGAYLAPDSQDEVLEIISSHLPLERSKPSIIDQLMGHLRF